VVKTLFSFFLVFFVGQNCVSQNTIKVQIVHDISQIGEVYITNVTSGAKAMLDSFGACSIQAKPDQTLVFSGLKIAKKTVNLKAVDFSLNVLKVQVYAKINQLDEVQIRNYPNINAVSLGIISKNVKKYTPAERRLRAGSSGLGIVQLLNALNGKTSELKKNVEVEKKQKMLAEVAALYPEEFYTQNLKIASNFIKGFQLFVIADPKIMRSIKNKNKIETELLMSQLAIKFNKITENDKK
jgi:hypothetical protein